MDEKRKAYKTRGFTYCDNIVRSQRTRLRNQERRDLRGQTFLRNRSLEVQEGEEKVDKKELHKLKYEKWKKAKEMRSQASKRTARPPFKCGAIKYNDADLYKSASVGGKVPKPQEQKPLAPAGFVFKAPKGIVPLVCKPLTIPQTPRSCKVFPTPQSSRNKYVNKENLGEQNGSESSHIHRDFATMSLLPVQQPAGSRNETVKSQGGGGELPERRRTRALTRFEREEKTKQPFHDDQ